VAAIALVLVWRRKGVGLQPAVSGRWFHVAEDEINHRGQIRWLRPRLPTLD
jgi:hypothetical protein